MVAGAVPEVGDTFEPVPFVLATYMAFTLIRLVAAYRSRLPAWLLYLSVIVDITLLLALIPPLAGFIGTTKIGWQIGSGDTVTLTTSSAYRIAFLYYLAMLAAVYSVGWAIHWMSRTYGAHQPLSQCFAGQVRGSGEQAARQRQGAGEELVPGLRGWASGRLRVLAGSALRRRGYGRG